MSDDRKDLPPVNSPNFLEKVREALSVYMGNRGDKLDRGVTLRDLTDSGLVTLRPGYTGGVGGRGLSPIGGAGPEAGGVYEPDLSPPPTPTGFTATAAISNLMIACAAQTYTQGHGHAKSVLYGATWISGTLPVFSDAVVLTEFSGTVASHATNPATTFHLWLKWVTVDGVFSTSPAGGTNGVVARTSEDVALLLTALTGQLKESQLFSTLGARINLIDGADNIAGSVNARVLAEATTRSTQTGNLFAQYTVKVDLNGYVAGYGLASTVVNGTPSSEFIIRADNFAIAPVATDNTATDGSPFFYRTASTTINGVTVPPGAYMKAAFIHDATITNAKIANLAVDNAKIADLSAVKITAGTLDAARIATGSLDAKIANLDAAVIGTGFIGSARINTASIANATISTAQIANATIDAVRVTGTITASQINGTNLAVVNGTFSGALAAATGTFAGSLSAATGTFGGSLSAATGTFSGNLSAAGGTFGGNLTASAVNAVNTINIAGNAITIPAGASQVSGITFGSSSAGGGTLLMSVSLDSGGAPIYVTTNLSIYTEGNNSSFTVSLLNNGAILSQFTVPAAAAGSSLVRGAFSDFLANPGTGVRNLEIRAYASNEATAMAGNTLFALGAKR